MAKTKKPTPDLDQLVNDVLNGQGFPFQEAVLRYCEGKAFMKGVNAGAFTVIGRELPVQLAGSEFHVDGVLAYGGELPTLPALYVSVECKRVNPAYSVWLFARSAQAEPELFIDEFQMRKGLPQQFGLRARRIDPMGGVIADTALSIKIDADTQDHKRVGDGFNKAFAQVWRGASGYAEHLAGFFRDDGVRPWRVQPMIVTTAPLLVVDTPLDEASVTSGVLQDTSFHQVQWLWYSSNVNNSLLTQNGKRSYPRFELTLRDQVRQRNQRVIMVTSPEGLEQVLYVLSQQNVTDTF